MLSVLQKPERGKMIAELRNKNEDIIKESEKNTYTYRERERERERLMNS